MRIFCPVCSGVGTVNVPMPAGANMNYYNPETGASWPQMACPNCGGAKLIGEPDTGGGLMTSDEYKKSKGL